jgi:hypothetical protein
MTPTDRQTDRCSEIIFTDAVKLLFSLLVVEHTRHHSIILTCLRIVVSKDFCDITLFSAGRYFTMISESVVCGIVL